MKVESKKKGERCSVYKELIRMRVRERERGRGGV